MKKISKILMALALCSFMVFGATACAKGMTEKSYGLVHNHYVGVATVEVKNDKITKVRFDEMEMPYSWARISNIKADSIAAGDIVQNGAYEGETKNDYAKKIKIGDTIFTARDNGTANNYVDYTNSTRNGATSLEDWMKVAANAKWYFEEMEKGNYDIIKEDDTAYNAEWNAVTGKTLTKKNRWLKSANGYWSPAAPALGWKGNMEKMQSYLEKFGFEGYTGDEVKGTGENDKTFKITVKEGQIEDTGATLVDFHDYMKIAQQAFEAAKTIEK